MSTSAVAFDGTRRLRLDPNVALRPEPFGALAYHYGNRRLTFLRATALVDLVRSLERFTSVDDALAASEIPAGSWPRFRDALASLEASEVLRAD